MTSTMSLYFSERVADDEHRLVAALLEDVPQPGLELEDGDVLLVDRDAAIGRVLEHDLVDAGVAACVRLALGFGRQVDVEALRPERQGGHEDDEQHQEHVNQRRDVHVRAGVRNLGLEDRFRAEVLVVVCVSHYCWPPAAAALRLLSDETHVLDARRPELVHRRHHCAVVDALIGLDEDDLFVLLLVLEEHLDRFPERGLVCDLLRVQVDVLVDARSRPSSGPASPACRPSSSPSAA